MKLKSRMAKSAGALALAVAGVAGAAGTAAAGSNGQQIEFFDKNHIAESVWVYGTNQNGQIAAGCWDTPAYDTPLTGWWWKGKVTLVSYGSKGCKGPATWSRNVDIPAQWGSDYYGVSDHIKG
ncbi:hypothetical protein [Streptomyces sp. NPDC037389]|uniref:hypothetical protein n=1 Tax=Streptomyces sp. NPDC037389 TaxID=3155369 RepID=UPI0033ECB0B2